MFLHITQTLEGAHALVGIFDRGGARREEAVEAAPAGGSPSASPSVLLPRGAPKPQVLVGEASERATYRSPPPTSPPKELYTAPDPMERYAGYRGRTREPSYGEDTAEGKAALAPSSVFCLRQDAASNYTRFFRHVERDGERRKRRESNLINCVIHVLKIVGSSGSLRIQRGVLSPLALHSVFFFISFLTFTLWIHTHVFMLVQNDLSFIFLNILIPFSCPQRTSRLSTCRSPAPTTSSRSCCPPFTQRGTSRPCKS
jgi:hypothetical protein